MFGKKFFENGNVIGNIVVSLRIAFCNSNLIHTFHFSKFGQLKKHLF